MTNIPSEAPRPVHVSSMVPVNELEGTSYRRGQHASKSLVDDNRYLLPRIVSRHPLDRDASIETRIEQTINTTSNPMGDRRFRVVVKNGPDPVLSHVHASFLLPENTQLPSRREHKDQPVQSLLAWTHFGGKSKTAAKDALSTFLCVLAHPNLLSIYNVYPQPNGEWTVQQEGWTVPLPLECFSIFPIPGGGLLLQRVPDESELTAVILEPPPQRSGLSPSTAFSRSMEDNLGFGNIPALFVMRHYQEDLTPLAHQHNGFWSDPLERVCFIGESHSYTSSKQSSSPDPKHDSAADEILLVTYHSQLQRHSVWSLHQAPPPPKPPTLPMYYAARHNYNPPNNATGFSGGLPYSSTLPPAFLWDHDDDMDDASTSNNMMNLDPMLTSQPRTQLSQRTRRSHGGGSVQNSDFGHSFTRQEALAEVLGVNNRKTPTAAATANSTRRAPPSLFSPAANGQHPMDTSHHAGGRAAMELDNDQSINRAPAMDMATTNFFSAIHSHFVTKCLYQETPKSSPTAACNIFLASDTRALGLSVLAMLVEQNGRKRLSLLQPVPAVDNSLSDVRRMELVAMPVECVDAQPVQSTPLVLAIKKCGGLPETHRLATDILILQSEGRLVLYRANTQITTLSYSAFANRLPPALSLTNPVGPRVTLNGPSHVGHRISIQLALPCPFAEQSLCAIQSSLETLDGDLDQVALLFRVDCIRVLQQLTETEPSVGRLPFKALAAVVMAIIRWDLVGEMIHGASTQGKSLASVEDAWASLQSSDFGIDHEIFPVASQSVKGEDPWFLSAYAQSNPQLLNFLMQKGSREPLTPLLFDPLHLLFEESKLSNVSFPSDLETLLSHICNISPDTKTRHEFLLYYESHCLSQTVVTGGDMQEDTQYTRPFTTFVKPPSIFGWVDDLLKRRTSSGYFESHTAKEINPACRHIRFVKAVLPLLFEKGTPASVVINELIEEGFLEQKEISEIFVPGIAFPLLSLLYKLTNEASQEVFVGTGPLSPEGFDLIGRNDLSLNLGQNDVGSGKAIMPPVPSNTMPLEAATDMDSEGNPSGAGSFADEEKDGLVPIEVTSSMLFKDNRIHEAARLLRSSRPAFLRVPRVVEISDHEYEQLKQKKLSLIVRRSLALPVGRGMMTIGGLKPLAAESLPIPDLSLKGRVPPTNGSLTLDGAECPPEIKVWPEFHNGVAAGLRLPEKADLDDRNNPINRTWILYNRPPRTEPTNNNEESSTTNNSKNHAHGGFLLALGLRGHLTALEMTDIYEYLTQGTISLTVGVLLGMAANKRGTCDMSISKMLCLHIPSLIPQHFSAIDVASAVQASAVTGVGLLYQRSSHRMMTEFLLNEIGKRPDSDTSAFDREAYTLSCGIALGMVNLCIAEKAGVDRAAGISDLRVEERLRRYIAGGQSNEEEARRVRESNDRFSIPASSNGVENEKCSVIFETNMINTDITAPAATLALGLMYMKSGNHTIASAVSIPQTHFTLEFVRPDYLGLRVVARSLILWDEVEPTQEWIDTQIPNVIHSAYRSMRTIAKKTMEGRTPAKMRGVDYDRRAVRQIYANIVAGACFSIGLHFAGTGDERAKKVLFDCVVQMHKLREGSDAVSVVSKPEFPILETCLGLIALSLGMVMAGTGDLDALRLFKTLRWRHDKEIVYGTHMVFGVAIGLLFLGGGTMTLGREPEDIAALIAAFFPRFPTDSVDNQYHLQALRHLYALAAKKSDVCAIDVDTGERVFVPIETISEGALLAPTKKQVPFLLLNSDVPIRSIRVVSDEFYPMTFRLKKGTNHFFVKRRGPPEPRSLAGPWTSDNDMAKILSQLEYLSLHPVDKPFFTQLISQKQAKDRYGIILVFLALMNGLRSLEPTSSDSIDLMWSLRLVRSFTENDVVEETGGSRYLPIESRILPLLLERAFQKLIPMKGNGGQHLISILYG